MTIGIYKLIFNDGSFYVGQSINIENRYLSHIRKMRKKEAAFKLQTAYNKCYDPEIELLIECKKDELNKYERHYILELDAIYNGLNSNPVGSMDYEKPKG